MDARTLFLGHPAHLLGGLLASGLFVGGALAVLREQAVAGVFLLLGGFVALLFLEYRRTPLRVSWRGQPDGI